MWIAILILFIVVIALIRYFSGSNTEGISEKNKELLDEVVEKLRIIQEFTNSRHWDKESGLTMIIPINAGGEMYSPNSDRIEISILLYESDPYAIELYTRNSNISEHFRLANVSGSFKYKANTMWHFHCNYKAMMSAIHRRVVSEFPNVHFEFDGSRVLTQKMKK